MHQQPKGMAPVQQFPGQMSAYKPGSAGNKDLHDASRLNLCHISAMPVEPAPLKLALTE
jgi:hypothetical protein